MRNSSSQVLMSSNIPPSSFYLPYTEKPILPPLKGNIVSQTSLYHSILNFSSYVPRHVFLLNQSPSLLSTWFDGKIVRLHPFLREIYVPKRRTLYY